MPPLGILRANSQENRLVEIEIPESLASRLFRFITDAKTTIAVDPSLLRELNAVADVQSLPWALLPYP